MSDRVLEQVPANGGCAFLFFSLINEKKRVTISPCTQTIVFIANYGIPSKLLFKFKYLFVIIIWLLLLAWVKCINTARHTEMLCFWAEYNYVGYINVAIMCNYVCTLDFLRCSTFLLLSHIFSFFPFFFFLLLPFFLSSPLPNWRGGWLQLFAVHFLVRRLLSAVWAILCLHNAVFTLTLIKVHLASKCCGLLNTDCTERRKWKRQSKQPRTRERERAVW